VTGTSLSGTQRIADTVCKTKKTNKKDVRRKCLQTSKLKKLLDLWLCSLPFEVNKVSTAYYEVNK
jgi:hypothetical protein